MSLEEYSWSTGKKCKSGENTIFDWQMQMSGIDLLWLSLVKSHNDLTSNLLLLAESDESRQMD